MAAQSNFVRNGSSTITVIGLTQFAFLALAITSVKILVHSQSSISSTVRIIDSIALWFFSIPVMWTGYATIAAQFSRPVQTVTYAIGITLAVISFLLLLAVVFYFPFLL